MKKILFVSYMIGLLWSGSAQAENAGNIIKASGVKGGLVVCIGADDPEFVAGLHVNDRYLVHALDVDQIIDEIKKGAATRLSGYLTPHHFGYNPETPVYPHDPDMARRLLAEAGYEDGLTLVFDIPSVMPDEAPALARMMAEQYSRVGITLEIVEHSDRSAYSEMVREKRINDAAGFDSSPRSTYRVLREKLHSGLRGPWWEGYDSEEVNSLIEEAQATISDTERQAIYRRIYTIVRDDAPWIFLYRPTRYWGVGSAMTDWQPRADGLLVFH